MIGTASCGPNAIIRAGISMIEAPKPTMPDSVPATSPSASTASQIMRTVRGVRPRIRPVHCDLALRGDGLRLAAGRRAIAAAGAAGAHQPHTRNVVLLHPNPTVLSFWLELN